MTTEKSIKFNRSVSDGAAIVSEKPNVLARIEAYKRQEIALAKQQVVAGCNEKYG